MDKIHHDVEGPFVLTNVASEGVRAEDRCLRAVHRPGHEMLYRPPEKDRCAGPCRCTSCKRTAASPTTIRAASPFVTQQVGQGAMDLRDSILDAWRDSKTMGVGWNNTPYDDYVANKVPDPWALIYGDD